MTINPAPEALPPSGVAEVLTGMAKPFLDTLTPALKQQKLSDMEREAAGIGAMSTEFDAAGREGRPIDAGRAYSAAIRAGMKGEDASNYILGLTGNTQGYKSDLTTNALVATGRPYHGSYQGTQDTLANARAIQQMQERTKLAVEAQKPHVVLDENNVPIVVRQGESYGRPASVPLTQVQGAFANKAIAAPGGIPALAEPEKKFIGAEPPADKIFNWVDRDAQGNVLQGTTTDAKTDLRTGQPLPATARLVSPGNAGGTGVFAPAGNISGVVLNKLTQARDENRQVIDLATQLKNMAANDPSIVGVAGNVTRGAQSLYGAGAGLAQMFGGQQNFDQQYTGVVQDLNARGVHVPGIQFNPNAPNIVKLNTILIYKAASALAGQSGRDISDADVKRAIAMVGDPASWLTDHRSYIAGLDLVTNQATSAMNTIDQQLRTNNIAPSGLGAPAATPTTAPTEVWDTGPDGRPVRVR